MATRDMTQWQTAICKVVSHDGEEEIVVRGHRMSDLIGGVSFAEAMFLMLQGRLPTKPQARVLALGDGRACVYLRFERN